jgi:hypothetical protein
MAKKKAVKDPFDHDGNGKPGGSLPKARRAVEPEVAPEPEFVAVKQPQFTSEGVLLNPQDFLVSPEGLLTAKA